MNITVNINKQLGGYTFSITPLTKASLKKQFPKSHPVNSVYMSDDMSADFKFYYKSFKKYLLPFLLGIDQKTLNKMEVELIDSSTNKKIEVV